MVNVIDRDTVLCISLAARPGNHGNRFHNFLYAELGLNYLYKSFTSSDIASRKHHPLTGHEAHFARAAFSFCWL